MWGELVKCIQYINLVWLYEVRFRIHAIQDPSHYYFAEDNDRFIQSDDLNEDFEGALVNLYENLGRGV